MVHGALLFATCCFNTVSYKFENRVRRTDTSQRTIKPAQELPPIPHKVPSHASTLKAHVGFPEVTTIFILSESLKRKPAFQRIVNQREQKARMTSKCTQNLTKNHLKAGSPSARLLPSLFGPDSCVQGTTRKHEGARERGGRGDTCHCSK